MNKSIKELLVLHFLNDGVRTTFPAILPFIAKELSFNLVSVGFLGSAQPLFAAILALPAGFLASRVGGFHFLVFLLLVYSIGALIATFTLNLPITLLAFSIAALGFGMFHTVGFSLVAKISEKNNIGRNMGNFTSVGDVGRVAIPPAAVFLVAIFGWRISMTAIALIGLSAFLLLRLNQPKKEKYHLQEEGLGKETHKEFISHILNLLKTKRLFLTLLAATTDALASSPIFLFLPFILFSKGVSVTNYGIITAAFFGGSLAGKFLLGRAVDKFGNLRVFIVSEILMAIFLVLLVGSSNFIIILILALLLGAFTRGTTPVIQAMLSEASEKMHYNKIYALSETGIGIAAVLTVILMGVIADQLGIEFVFYIAAIFALLATIPTLLLSRSKSFSG